MHNFIENLTWRGMIQNYTPGLEEQLKKGCITGYIGFDPTASSLHVGNLATIMLLKHLQLAGHKPLMLIGGATGMVGDPSFKLAERKFLDEEVLLYNQACIMKQLNRFLDFTTGPQAAVLVNNMDWFGRLSFLKFLREAGKYITVNYMMAKESVRRRLEEGISFTEFSYQLLQAYDFYHLYTTQDVVLQMGGADQWGNLTTGIEFIRKKTGRSAFSLTTPLITRADGGKFGKTEQGTVWLDPALTSPYEFYQFWMNCTDEEAIRFVKVFTLLDQGAIESLVAAHQQVPHQRILQKALAKELMMVVHTMADYELAVATATLLFGNALLADLQAVTAEDWSKIFKAIPEVTMSKEVFESTEQVIDLVASTGIGILFDSKSMIRRAIAEGGLLINKEKITDGHQLYQGPLLQDKYLLVQRGKKHHYIIKII
jgi:tyrosyl-tRNA synthetase